MNAIEKTIFGAVMSIGTFLIIMAVGSSYGVNPSLTFVGAIAAGFGVLIGTVKKA